MVMCLGQEASIILGKPEFKDDVIRQTEKWGGGTGLCVALPYLCEQTDKKVVLIIDDMDSLVGDTLISVLRQLRTCYPDRMSRRFPTSVIFCGVEDIKDYKIHRSDGELITGGAASTSSRIR